jgi:hypothetical protein
MPNDEDPRKQGWVSPPRAAVGEVFIMDGSSFVIWVSSLINHEPAVE